MFRVFRLPVSMMLILVTSIRQREGVAWCGTELSGSMHCCSASVFGGCPDTRFLLGLFGPATLQVCVKSQRCMDSARHGSTAC